MKLEKEFLIVIVFLQFLICLSLVFALFVNLIVAIYTLIICIAFQLMGVILYLKTIHSHILSRQSKKAKGGPGQ